MLFRTTVIASVALAFVASTVEAHSWADCVDWRFNDPKKPDETRQNPISKSYTKPWGAQAKTTAGKKICMRWPAKNHAVKEEPEHFVFINMPNTTLSADPSQAVFSKNTIAKLPYKNCNDIAGDTDHTPCGGCFTVPATLATGNYVVQWRWQLNPNEFYTSCWDLGVTAAAAGAVVPLGAKTSIFAELAED
ncbi:hypothetical protein BGZ98_010291 [Dissophora globulifera]|nr:hypothetical protein BGZ98_010291 [Dissophora globulifera]